MIWLVAIVLGVVAWRQHRRLTALKDQVFRLSVELTRLSAVLERASVEPVARPGPWSSTVAPFAAPPATPIVEPTPDPQTEPSLLEPAPEPSFEEQPAPVVAPIVLAPADAPTVAAREPRRSVSLADWLSENGLAWLGGGVLGLGGLLLVAYAASRGLFTPPFRIAAAVLVGAASLGAGEWLRRRSDTNDRLVAALTTAAGAVILYGAAWAAHGLYGLIPVTAAAVLLALISLGLLALSAWHGEPLALLAIAGANIAPAVSGVGVWNSASLDAYAVLILATGLGAATLRGWLGAAGLSLGAAAIWALMRLAMGDPIGCAVLAATGPLLTLARRSGFGARGLSLTLPAMAGAGLLAFVLAANPVASDLSSAAVVVAVVALVGSVSIRRTHLATDLLPAAIALVLIAGETNLGQPMTPGLAAFLALPLLAVIAAGLAGGQQTSETRLAAGCGAVSAALAMTLADPTLARAFGNGRAAIDAAAAALVLGAAVLTARRSGDARKSVSLAIWIGGAAEIVGLALHAATPGPWSPIAYAGLGLALAALAIRPGWRGFAEASTVAALAAFAALLGPGGASEVFTRPELWVVVAARCAAVAAIQTLAWRMLKRRGDLATLAQAVSTLAILNGLLAYFLIVRGLAGMPGGERMDGFLQASMRSIVLLAAGLTLLSRDGATVLGRLRGPVVLAVAAIHVVALQLLAFHPWWGAGRAVSGPPVVDSLMLGLLAPALLLGQAARRLLRVNRPAAKLFGAVAFVVLLIWEVTEIRRLFHGPYLRIGPFGYVETALYAVALLASSAAVEGLGRWRGAAALDAAPAELLKAFDWAGGATALVLLAWLASPWWGPLPGDLNQPWLLGLAYVAAAALTFVLARAAAQAGDSNTASFLRVSLAIELFVLMTLAVRFAFNGGTIRAALSEESLETWTFSALWALFGLATLAVAVRREDRPLRWTALAILLGTTLKVFLFDLGRLSGVARAASFLALGAILLVAALAARRLSERTRPRQDSAPLD